MDPILCKTHNVAKVPMRNKRNAPMLGCPMCHPAKAPQETLAETKPTEQPKSAPVTPPKQRIGFTLLGLARSAR